MITKRDTEENKERMALEVRELDNRRRSGDLVREHQLASLTASIQFNILLKLEELTTAIEAQTEVSKKLLAIVEKEVAAIEHADKEGGQE